MTLVIWGSIGDMKEQFKKTKEDYYVQKEFDETVIEAKAYVDTGDQKRNKEYKDKLKIL